MVQTAARVLAHSALRLLQDKAARDAAMAEFKERTGGGVGGDSWIAPLCDYEPPLGFAWPEYVETPRGRDWHIPSR
jgi:aminobenzoyl-glutamate utilization protein B